MKKSRLFAVALVMVVGVACGGGDEEGGDTSGESADALPVTVTAEGFAFSPDSLEGHATHTVDLTFVNEDDTAHTFTIDEMDVDVQADGGEEATATFTPDEMGTFTYYCKIHPDMKGEIEVT